MKKIKFQKDFIPWNKNKNGFSHSEEQKKKISLALKGKKKPSRTEEHKRKLSETLKGRPAWNKGKKIGFIPWNKGKKGIMPTPWNKSKKTGIIPWNKGKTISQETKEKLSKSLKGKVPWNKGKKIFISEETRKKMKAGLEKFRGIPRSEEVKRKIGEAGKRAYSEGRRVNPNKNKHLSEEHKKRIGEAQIGKVITEEQRKKMSKTKLDNWRLNPELREKYVKTNRENLLKLYESGKFPKQENTKPERQIKEELLKRGYREGMDFIHQYKFMNKFMCDFCFPKQKVIVEVYGDFWHANPEKYSEKKLHQHQIKDIGRDKSKEAYITKVDNNTWTYLVLWESDIKKDVIKCVDKIEETLNKTRA